jgi:hypothetical protein
MCKIKFRVFRRGYVNELAALKKHKIKSLKETEVWSCIIHFIQMEAHRNWLIRPSKTIDRSTMFVESEVKLHTQVLHIGATSCIVRQNVIAQTSLTKIINYTNLVSAYITKCNIYSTQCDLFDIRRCKFN